MKERLLMDLQRFAELNTQTTGAAALAPEMKTYYEKKLLENASPNLVHNQFGDKYPIPKAGGKMIEWRKFTPLPKALTPLTEAVTPDGNSMKVEALTAQVKQYGDYISQSDMLEMTAIDNTILQATKLLGNQAGETMDTLTREELHGGTNVFYAPKVAADGTQTPVTGRGDLDGTALMTVPVIVKIAAWLRTNNIKTVNGGSYVAIIHPLVEAELINSKGFIDVVNYSRPEDIYDGEVGKLGGVRFVRSSEAKVVMEAGQAVFCTLFIGNGAYGVTEIEGGGLEHIVKQRGYGEDPLNQRSAVGWKATHAAKRLNEKAIIRLEHCIGDSTGVVVN
ncbi:MAG: N4-gp56 family major capsid protein [Clostridiales bacterium]|nr:N4-gp56 family major capsid protein [Clostridiales bacterium]